MKFMKVCFCFIIIFFFNSLSIFSQEKYQQHTVVKGETISEIAKQYSVKPSEIYELNPDARNGIKFKTVLLIPAKAKKSSVSTSKIVNNLPEITHEVLTKETLYGIAKQHNITIEDLYKINPDLEKEGLKKGQIIKIPHTAFEDLVITKEPEKAIEVKKPNDSKKNIPKQEIVVAPKADEKMDIPTEGIVYEVLPRESFYSIAKKHKITVADLQKSNATLVTKSLKVGQKIRIPVKAAANASLVVEKAEKDTSSAQQRDKQAKPIAVLPQPIIENKKVENEISREVLPKETKYGIAKEYGITVAELEKQNPEIIKKLPIGYLLKISSSKTIENVFTVEVVAVKEESIDKNILNNDVAMVHDAAFVDQLILTASENIGTQYRSGGTTKEGFDCSGLMCYTFNSYDIKLPRSSIEMSDFGSKIDTENAQKGDLIFFKTNGRRQINHVGMVIEVLDGEIKFIHSSNHGGVMISSTKESYYEKNLVQVNRVL
jgi:cell wall-associated NlpC family hydrolase